MSSTDEPYIPPPNPKVAPLPSVEITEGNIFTGYTTRGLTAEELGLYLSDDGHWLSVEDKS